MIDQDLAPTPDTAQWQLQVQVTGTSPGADGDPARRWAAPITAAPETPAELCALLRAAAASMEEGGQGDGNGNQHNPYLVAITLAEVIAGAGNLDDMRAVLRGMGDSAADDKHAPVVYCALLGHAQATLEHLANMTRRLAGLS